MEILKGFVFDIQRFALPTSGVQISVISSLAGGWATDAPKLIYNGADATPAYSWVAADASGEEIGTGNTTGDALNTFTLAASVTEVVADAAWTGVTIKAHENTSDSNATVTFHDNNTASSVKHSFTVLQNQGVTITTYTTNGGYTLGTVGSTDKDVTLTKGTFTIDDTATAVAVVPTTDSSVTVGNNTFTDGSDNTYKHLTTGDTINIGTDGVVSTSSDSDVASVTAGTVTFNTNDAIATFKGDASTQVIYDFKDGSIEKTNATGNFVWKKAATETSAEATANDITFTGFTGKLTGSKTSAPSVTTFSAGTITTGEAASSLYVVNGTYTYKTQATFEVDSSNVRVTGGTFTIDAADPGLGSQEINTAKATAPETVIHNVKATSGDVDVTVEDDGTTTITDLAAGESVSVYEADGTTLIYSLSADKNGEVVTYTKGGTQTFYQRVDGATLANAEWTASSDGTITGGGSTILTKVNPGPIKVAEHPSETWFKATGQAFSDEPDTYAAHLTVDGTGESATRELKVSSEVIYGVVIDSVTTTVVDDSNANTTYKIKNGTGYTWINGKEFTVSSEGVISDTNGGTITLLADGDVNELKLSGTVNVNTDDIGAATDRVLTYVAGESVNGAKITLDNDNSPIVLTESTNATDTVIYQDGDIEGLDAGGIVKNAVDTKTITTAGSETSANVYTINGVEWTVTGDAETTFIVDASETTQLSAITNLDLDATVTTTKKFSQEALVINGTNGNDGTTFNDVVSKDGVTFTSTKKNDTASITLNAVGEAVTIGNKRYTVSATSDDVTIDSTGKITGLTNGDKITVHDTTDTNEAQSVVTLTVNNGALVVSGVNADGAELTNTTYTLDSGETSFEATVNAWNTTGKTGTAVNNGSAAETVDGFSVGTGSTAVGNESIVSSVANGMYLDKDGKTLADNDSGKAVAQIQMENDVITYTEIGDKAQSVIVGAAETNYEWNITTNGGKDTIEYKGRQNATINSGAGNDYVDAASNSDLYINLGAGKDTVTVGGAGDHTIVAGEGNSVIRVGATGDVRVDATGAGNKQIYHTGAGVATLYGGDGNDTIKAYGMDDSVVGGAGNNVFDVTTTGMKVSDYNVTKDAVSVAGASASTALADSQFLGDGTVSLSATKDHVLDVSDGTGVSGYYAIAAEGTDGKKQFFGWAQDSGSNIDASTVEESVILIGNNNDDKADTLMGGTKNDVIYAGEGDAVYGGAGKDRLVLDSTTGNQTVYTATTAGKDTVTGFTAGFEDGDTINFVDGTASDVTFDYADKTVTVKDGDGSLTITNLDTVASGAVELFAANTKVALTGEKGIIKTDSVSYADVYVGDGSAVDFSSVEGGLHVNLANGIAGDANLARFSGITSVKGGTGATTLMGATSAESLVSGGGNTSLWGSAGKDTLVGGDGKDMFFIGAGDGTDTMTKFTGGTDATSDTLFVLSDITGAKLGSTGVEVSTTDAKAVLSGTNANTAIHFATNGAEGVAKVGSATANNNFNYDSTVTYYGGGSKSDKIAFTSGSTENAEIWLDGSHGKAYASIDVVDGTNASGNLLVAGDSSSQSIIGGKGDTSIWGGAGNATDTLRSSSTGKTMFWWGAGEGNDLIVSTSADDSVNLYNLKLSDVDVANSSITNSGVSLALNDGSKLTVQTGRDMTFSIDGQSWTSQRNSKTWKQNS